MNARAGFKRFNQSIALSIKAIVLMSYKIISDHLDIIHICCSTVLSFYSGICSCFVVKLLGKHSILHLHSRFKNFSEGRVTIFVYCLGRLYYCGFVIHSCHLVLV